MRLARKITLALFVLAVAIIASLETFDVTREVEEARAAMARDHAVLGRVIAASFSRIWQLEGSQAALGSLEDANRTQHRIRLRWVFWDETQGLYAPRVAGVRAEGDEPVSVEREAPAPGERITYVPATVGGRAGALELSESLEALRRRTRATLSQVLVASGGVAIVFLLGAIALGRFLVARPVEALVGMARRLGSGDLTAQAQVQSHDEIGELAAAMNDMAAALAAARERLVEETRARLATLESLRHADRLSTIGKLASGIAHELGTPLNVVSARAKMISSREVDGDDALASARTIHEQAQAMTRIIRQLLDFARTRTPNREVLRVDGLIARTVGVLEPLIASKRVEVTREGGASETVSADAGQLQQVLTNLLVNALQAVAVGGHVTVRHAVVDALPPSDLGAVERRFLRIDIADDGAGIPPEVLPRLFEPFFTTKPISEGTGLGLSVSYGLIRDHGGWITVDSAPGRGSTFSVFLPAEVA